MKRDFCVSHLPYLGMEQALKKKKRKQGAPGAVAQFAHN